MVSRHIWDVDIIRVRVPVFRFWGISSFTYVSTDKVSDGRGHEMHSSNAGKTVSDTRRCVANRDGYPQKMKSTLMDGYVKHTLIFRLGNV